MTPRMPGGQSTHTRETVDLSPPRTTGNRTRAAYNRHNFDGPRDVAGWAGARGSTTRGGGVAGAPDRGRAGGGARGVPPGDSWAKRFSAQRPRPAT
ncbi:hypothetical protein PG994_007136 [Apiospora phragmitis]|uniref:Uncharacterized protein n=1 Tax=Apiospora phragmitis TaxID=2905665 RepID=A0ABR1UZX2_9PEZI